MPKVLNLKNYFRKPLPPNSVVIDRTTKWGNPFIIGTQNGDRDCVVNKYDEWIPTQPHLINSLHELKDKDLLCWCAPKRCHGDILLELANGRNTR